MSKVNGALGIVGKRMARTHAIVVMAPPRSEIAKAVRLILVLSA